MHAHLLRDFLAGEGVHVAHERCPAVDGVVQRSPYVPGGDLAPPLRLAVALRAPRDHLRATGRREPCGHACERGAELAHVRRDPQVVAGTHEREEEDEGRQEEGGGEVRGGVRGADAEAGARPHGGAAAAEEDQQGADPNENGDTHPPEAKDEGHLHSE